MTKENVEQLPSIISGGYSLLTAGQLAQILAALNAKHITFRAFRTFFACIEMREARKACFLSQSKQAVKGRYARYTPNEVGKRTNTEGDRFVRRALRSLEQNNLLSFTPKSISAHRCAEMSDQTDEILKLCQGNRRSPYRRVPVPRRVLRFLSVYTQPTVAKALLLHLLRGLSLKRGGLFQTKGTIKCSLLAAVGQMSLRAAKAARKSLLQLGIITPDATRSQRKLNRTGAFFTINLTWKWIKGEKQEIPERCAESLPVTQPSPPSPSNVTYISPPNKKLGTSLHEVRNHKLCSRPTTSGLLKRKPRTKVTFSNVQYSDLDNLSKLRKLFRDAQEQNFIQHSEASWLSFVAAAVRARRHGGEQNAPRFFAGIIRKKLYHHITHAEEDEAQRMIKQHRSGISNIVQSLLSDVFGTPVCRTGGN